MAERVTLEEIISGKRCTPLTAQEFQLWLKHVAYSLENLQFHYWYTAYCRKFEALPLHEQLRCPQVARVNSRVAPVYNPKLSQRDSSLSWTSSKDSYDDSPTISSPLSMTVLPTLLHNPRVSALDSRTDALPWRRRGSKQDDSDSHIPSIAITADSASDLPYDDDASSTATAQLPFLDEITRVVATFILPKSPNELNIDANTRRSLLKHLALDERGRPTGSTHPDVFAPVAEACWAMMRDSSLPDFLRFAAGNINPAKERFWYAVGAADISVGIVIGLLCKFLVMTRWARLGALPFLNFGTMQAFSASKHFCTQVYGRDARQLYPWELIDPSLRPSTDSPDSKDDTLDAADFEKGCPSPHSIAPWDDELPAGVVKRNVAADQISQPLRGISLPIFGPETALKDPFIQRVQKRLILLILVAGMIGMSVFGAILLALPLKA